MTALVNALGVLQTNSPASTITYISATAGPPVLQSNLWTQWAGAEWLQQSTNTCYKFFANGTWVPLSQSSSNAPLTWVATSNSQGSNPNYGYLITGTTAPVIITLPSVAAFGSIVIYTSASTSTSPLPFPGFTIAQNPNQQIFSGTHATTLGVAGYVTVGPAMSVVLVCEVANTTWNVQSVNGGTALLN